jgi:hypothetical protein
MVFVHDGYRSEGKCVPILKLREKNGDLGKILAAAGYMENDQDSTSVSVTAQLMPGEGIVTVADRIYTSECYKEDSIKSGMRTVTVL